MTNDLMLWTVVLIVGLGALFRLQSAPPTSRTPDERTYAAYADTLVRVGVVPGARRLTARYLGDPAQHVDPPPTRLGYLVPLALATRIRGDATAAGVGLSHLASLASLVLAALIAWRLIGPWGALFTSLLLVAAPQDLAVTRRVWQDGVLGAGSAALILLTVLLAHPPPGRKARMALVVGFGLTGAWLTTVKESGMGLLLVALLIASVTLWKLRERRLLLALWAVTAAAAALAWTALLAAVGGPGQFVSVYRAIAGSLPSSPYNIEYQSGPLWYGVEGLWLLAPFTVVFFVLGAIQAVAAVGTASLESALPRNRALLALALFCVGWLIVVGAPPYLKNLRFYSPAVVPMYVVAGSGFARVLVHIRASGPRAHAWTAATLLCIAAVGSAMQVRRFDRLKSLNDVRDLTLPFLEGRPYRGDALRGGRARTLASHEGDHR